MLTAQLSDGLGNVVDDITKVIQKGERYLDIIVSVLDDPALPTVATQIRTLSSMPSSSSSAPTWPGAPAPPKKLGIGLQAAVGPLNAYIWSRKHKAATIALGIAALLVPIGAGVLVGRLTKRCRVGAKK